MSEIPAPDKPIESLPPFVVKDWQTFLRELPRLLAEGHEGRCALVFQEEIVEICDDEAAAFTAGYFRFGVSLYLTQPITREPVRPVLSSERWARSTPPEIGTWTDRLPTGDDPMYPEDELMRRQWRVFCRELPRLLAEGHDGKFALVYEDNLIGIWDDREEARAEGFTRFGFATAFLVQPIARRTRVYRIRGY